MDPHEIDSSLYDSYAAACDERRDRILALLDAYQAGKLEVHVALERIAIELHDHIGDSKLINFDKLSETAVDLERIVLTWKDSLLPSKRLDSLGDSMLATIRSNTFRSWLERLTQISKRFAQTVGDSGQVRDLQNLRLELEKALEAAPEQQRKKPPDTAEVLSLRQLKMLVLDDSAISRRLLTHALEQKGHAVMAAASADQLWEFLSDVHPDMIFLDINMPDIKGDEVCRQLRRNTATKNIPIIIFSSLPDEDLAVLALSSGADGYLSKQHGLQALQTFLDELMEQVMW